MKAAISIRPESRTNPLEQGFSLVELMVAMVIGLIVVLVVGALFINSKQTYLAQDANSRLQENARYATELFGRQIRSAGYPATNFNPLPGNNLFAKPLSTKFVANPPHKRLDGVDGGSLDTITVSFDGNKDCLGQLAVQPWNKFQINASSQLECVSFSGGNTGVILDDVESMQVTYREKNTTNYVDAGLVANMDNVLGVRICLLLRAKADSDKRAIESSINKSYVDCAGATVPKTDGYIRRAVTTTVALRNPYLP
jgi:type IV pilus assembly protein PilW